MRVAAKGALPPQVKHDDIDLSYEVLRELHIAGKVSGTRYDPDRTILVPEITPAGREYLSELEKLVMPHHKSITAKFTTHTKTKLYERPIRSFAILLIVGTMLAIVFMLVKQAL